MFLFVLVLWFVFLLGSGLGSKGLCCDVLPLYEQSLIGTKVPSIKLYHNPYYGLLV